MVSKETKRRRVHNTYSCSTASEGLVIKRVPDGFRVFRREFGDDHKIYDVPVRTFASEPAAERYVLTRVMQEPKKKTKPHEECDE